jgi:hypothetical protein
MAANQHVGLRGAGHPPGACLAQASFLGRWLPSPIGVSAAGPADVVREIRRLSDRIRHQGGAIRVLSIAFTDPVKSRP